MKLKLNFMTYVYIKPIVKTKKTKKKEEDRT